MSYEELKRRLAQGWNTWNTRSVLSHVLLPEGLAINLCMKEYYGGGYLKEALIGRQKEHEERVVPGPRTYDGSYTELTIAWQNMKWRVQSAVVNQELVVLVTPLLNQRKSAVLVVEFGLLWNKPGTVQRTEDGAVAHLTDQTVSIHITEEETFEPYAVTQTPYYAVPMDRPIGISTSRKRTLSEILDIIEKAHHQQQSVGSTFGELSEAYAAMQTCLAWNTIYDPLKDRVISPVSRIWNCERGGYVLFCWDQYFAAYMAALDNKDLAFANAIEITRERTKDGFVPNVAVSTGRTSLDRSQPPVGSLVVRELYRKYRESWLLEELFDDLLLWNRWWETHRLNQGLLSWGSHPHDGIIQTDFDRLAINKRLGASLESGLDNSPMYDDIPFNSDACHLELQDVGLNSLFIADCIALAEIAEVLGRTAEAAELRMRGDRFTSSLSALWDEDKGIYLNKRTDTGDFSYRLSPTNFYPLLGRIATEAQVERMMNEHFYNPQEFWGEWILPAIARNDPAFADQNYWRGRVWAPLNLLVYLGMRNYNLTKARQDLAEKSRELLLKEWREHGHVHENYNSITGEGCDQPNSDGFYHWGGLLTLISFIEKGYLGSPEESIC